MLNLSFKPSESVSEIKNTRKIYFAVLIVFLIIFILIFTTKIKLASTILFYTAAVFALVTFWATRKVGIKPLLGIFLGAIVFLIPEVNIQGIPLPIVPLISAYAILGWKWKMLK